MCRNSFGSSYTNFLIISNYRLHFIAQSVIKPIPDHTVVKVPIRSPPKRYQQHFPCRNDIITYIAEFSSLLNQQFKSTRSNEFIIFSKWLCCKTINHNAHHKSRTFSCCGLCINTPNAKNKAKVRKRFLKIISFKTVHWKLENAFGGWQFVLIYITLHCHFNWFGKGFENSFNFMMFVVAFGFNVKIHSCSIAQRFKKCSIISVGKSPTYSRLNVAS